MNQDETIELIKYKAYLACLHINAAIALIKEPVLKPFLPASLLRHLGKPLHQMTNLQCCNEWESKILDEIASNLKEKQNE